MCCIDGCELENREISSSTPRVFDWKGWNSNRLKMFQARIWRKKENSKMFSSSRDMGSKSAKFGIYKNVFCFLKIEFLTERVEIQNFWRFFKRASDEKKKTRKFPVVPEILGPKVRNLAFYRFSLLKNRVFDWKGWNSNRLKMFWARIRGKKRKLENVQCVPRYGVQKCEIWHFGRLPM